MNAYQSVAERTSEVAMPEFRQPARALMSPVAWPHAAKPGHGTLQGHDARLFDVRFTDVIGCDITATLNSTRMGPPSCSPPV